VSDPDERRRQAILADVTRRQDRALLDAVVAKHAASTRESRVNHIEAIARAITAAEGVDPDHPCVGVGRIIPDGETWPAWRVRVPRAEAARAVVVAEIVAWLRREHPLDSPALHGYRHLLADRLEAGEHEGE
jgi:hypothetical protein